MAKALRPHMVTLRMAPEELERLERVRRHWGMRSRSSVLRWLVKVEDERLDREARKTRKNP